MTLFQIVIYPLASSQLCKFEVLVYERELGGCRVPPAGLAHTAGGGAVHWLVLSFLIAFNLLSYPLCWLVFSRPPVAYWS